jgi:hypothetical protein
MEENLNEKRNINEVFTGNYSTLGTPWKLLVFTFILFIFSLLVYFGLKIGYENYLKSQLETLDKKINDLSNSISEEDQQRFISAYSQIINLKNVLNNHVFSSNIFNFLEKNTLPKVFYNSATFSSPTRTIVLNGQADSLMTLASQLALFEKSKDVESVELTGMNFVLGGVSFGINIVLKQDYLSKPL